MNQKLIFFQIIQNKFVFRCGGPWHITDMRRGESIFDLDPSLSEEVENGIEKEGSNLSGVSAKISWSVMTNEVTKIWKEVD